MFPLVWPPHHPPSLKLLPEPSVPPLSPLMEKLSSTKLVSSAKRLGTTAVEESHLESLKRKYSSPGPAPDVPG